MSKQHPSSAEAPVEVTNDVNIPNSTAQDVTRHGSGNTGGPGMPGKTPGKAPGQPSLPSGSEETSESMTFEEFQALVKSEVTRTMVGGTGGMAGVPETVEQATAVDFTPADFLESIKRGEFDALPLEAKVEAFHTTNKRFIPILGTARTIGATVAVVLGAMANTIKAEVRLTKGPKAWTPFRRENLDQKIHPNTLKLYMDVASIANVEKYLGLGVDRLGKLGALIASSDLRSDDPIQYILSKVDKEYSVHLPVEDFKLRCDAALVNHRLQAKGLDIPFETLVNARNCGLDIDKTDIDEMAHRKANNQDPLSYLTALMDEPDSRKDLLTHKKGSSSESKGKSLKVQDINGAVQDLDETVVDALSKETIEVPLEEERIERLIENLRKLQDKVRAQSKAV